MNGARGRSNNFTVDGSDNNDEDVGMRRQGFVSLVPQSAESVREFQVITAGFTADFGRNSGGMVNAVSRSGEQDFHGEAYGLFTPRKLSAHSFVETPFAKSGFDHHQYGAVVGGPIVKQKLFHFLSAERQTVQGDAVRHFVVPALEERGLRIRNGFVPINQLGSFFDQRDIRYSDLAGTGVLSLYPLPNNPAGPFGTNNYSQVRSVDNSGSILSAKTDWYLSKAHSFAARYNFTNDSALIPFTGDAINSSVGNETRTQNLSLFLNSVLPSFGNALRISYGRTRLEFPSDKGSPLVFGSAPSSRVQVAPIDTAYGRFGPFGSTGPIGQLLIAPYSAIGIDVFNFPQGRVDNTFQVGDFVTHLGTHHTRKFGFDIRRTQLNSFSERNSRPLVVFAPGTVSSTCVANPTCPFNTSDGLLRGTDLAALGAPSGFLQTLSTQPAPDTSIALRFTQYDLFVQDDWKARANLTFNVGLRYELQTVPAEAHGRIEKTFDLSADQFGHLRAAGTLDDQRVIDVGNRAFDRALTGLQAFLGGRKRIYEPDHTNFAPRFGFAWDPFGSGTTAVRGGYTLAYDAILGAVTSQSRNVFPAFVPVNLDLNFRFRPDGLEGAVLNNPALFTFGPTRTPLIRPGTLNTYNITGDGFATGLGTLFNQSPPTPGASLGSNGLAFTLPEKEMRRSYAQQYVLSLERQFGQRSMVSISYVGTRGLRLPRFVTPNAGFISSPILLSSPNSPLQVADLPPRLSRLDDARPMSGLGAITVFQNSAHSMFHSMQMAADQRWSKGVQTRWSWTWSHAIDDLSDPFDGRSFFALPQDSTRLDLERASANFDVRHRVTGFIVWDVQNWKVSAVGEFQTGQPYTINTSVDRNYDGNLTDRPPGIGRNSERAAGIATVDLAVSRRIAIADHTSVVFRAETFNIANRTHRGIPVRILESPGFGKSFDTQVDPRSIRFSFKFSF